MALRHDGEKVIIFNLLDSDRSCKKYDSTLVHSYLSSIDLRPLLDERYFGCVSSFVLASDIGVSVISTRRLCHPLF